jgi:hypothetical protein
MSFKLSALAWNVEVDKSADRLVLLALASKADDNGRNCFPSVESICGLTVLNRKTVFAVISRLADRGLITVRKRVSTNSNEYLLHVDRWTENGSTENGTAQKGDNPKTVQRSSQKRDDGSTENGTTVVPKTGHYSINTQSDTQSITQSESLPERTPLDDDQDEQKQNSQEKASRSKRTRLTIEVLPDDWREYCAKVAPEIDPDKAWEDFKDYWQVKAKDPLSADWKRTWQSNVRKLHSGPDWMKGHLMKASVRSFKNAKNVTQTAEYRERLQACCRGEGRNEKLADDGVTIIVD